MHPSGLKRGLHRFVHLLLLFIFIANPLALSVKAAVDIPQGFYYYDTVDLTTGGLYPLSVFRHYQSATASGGSIAAALGPFGPGTHRENG